jgi:hypothetical protein
MKSVNESVNVFAFGKGPFVHGERACERCLKIATNQLKNNNNRVNEKRNERLLAEGSFVHGRSIGGIRGIFLNGASYGQA